MTLKNISYKVTTDSTNKCQNLTFSNLSVSTPSTFSFELHKKSFFKSFKAYIFFPILVLNPSNIHQYSTIIFYNYNCSNNGSKILFLKTNETFDLTK